MALTMPTFPDGCKESTSGNSWDEFGRCFTEEEKMEIRLYSCGVLDRISSEKVKFQTFRTLLSTQGDSYVRLVEKRKTELKHSFRSQLWVRLPLHFKLFS